jgi:hypothetical protein
MRCFPRVQRRSMLMRVSFAVTATNLVYLTTLTNTTESSESKRFPGHHQRRESCRPSTRRFSSVHDASPRSMWVCAPSAQMYSADTTQSQNQASDRFSRRQLYTPREARRPRDISVLSDESASLGLPVLTPTIPETDLITLDSVATRNPTHP